MNLSRVFSVFFGPSSDKQNAFDAGLHAEDKDFVRTLAHAQTGYENAQNVIKAIDTKTTIVTGLSTLAGGFLIAIIKWSIELDEASPANLQRIVEAFPRLSTLLFIFIGFSFLNAFFCIGASVWSVVARQRPKNLENRFTILFPAYRRADAKDACRYFEDRLRDCNKSAILKEYEDQLRIVGMILGHKLRHNRTACIALLLQIFLLGCALTTILVMYVWK
jgi:hypothetical protein